MKNYWFTIVFLLMLSFLGSSMCFAQQSGGFGSSSSMMNTGSSYSSQVTAVGAVNPQQSYPTYSSERENAIGGFITPGESGQSDQSPVGEPYVLLVFAAAFAIYVAVRRAKKA